ncbi:hypothetical protein [Nocardioides coralli]|uniref:hypothetical protein n=1 Tax=Nocardioides coralli TaxID=2872154 RepID=UPI001CA46A16|nr:hypothetical protein [Nocardioides coralli]QZY30371.1 hypothetical protein K6T13_06855 [Nocardioides coralli]
MDNSTRTSRVALVVACAALLISTTATGGPALARLVFADNADKVDGKHAVGSKASATQRKGKLVATSKRTGRLPNNIIRKAGDSDLLDGRDANDFLSLSSPAGRLVGEGLVSSAGALSGAAGAGMTASKTGTGFYSVLLPGLRPGCVGTIPNLVATPFGGGQVAVPSVTTNCGSGDTSMAVATSNSAGTATDGSFFFAVFSGNPVATSPASARLRGNPSICSYTPEGRTCR